MPSPLEILRRLDSGELLSVASEVRTLSETRGFTFLLGLVDSERRRAHERLESGRLAGEAAYASDGGYARGMRAVPDLIELIFTEARRAEGEAAAAVGGEGGSA